MPAGSPTVIYQDRKSTRLNSSHLGNSYAVFCLKTKRGPSERETTPRAAPIPAGPAGIDLSTFLPASRAWSVARWEASAGFCVEFAGAHRDLHSFPTRRSAD